eukprot:3898400-Karenia_brevis.AAC.1
MHVVSKYKHMGSRETVSGSLLLEIQSRMGDMHATFNSLRSKFFRNRGVPIDRKLIAGPFWGHAYSEAGVP